MNTIIKQYIVDIKSKITFFIDNNISIKIYICFKNIPKNIHNKFIYYIVLDNMTQQ